MTFVVTILAGIALLVLLLVGVAYLLPREITVEREILVEAPPAAVFPHIESLRMMQGWSPWLDRDPDVAVTFDGPETGVGARMSWRSKQRNVGNGTQEITDVDPGRAVTSALDFGEMGAATAVLTLDEVGSGTRVTWSLLTDMGASPVGRWMGLAMDRMVGKDYDTGLRRLKAVVESA